MADGASTGRRRAAAWLAAVGAVLVIAGCGGGSDDEGGGGGMSAPEGVGAPDRAAPPAPGPNPGQSAADTGQSGSVGGARSTDLSTSGIRLDESAVIRTAELTVRVDDVAARARQAQDHARAGGGVVAGDNRSGSGDDARADLVLRVRPERLDGVLDQLSALGEELQRASSSQDVTEQVADVRSRVATMEASIARVRAILSRATRIGDVVAVEGELSRRVTELESLQARQRALADRVGLATVTLHLTARDAAPPPAVDRGGFLGGLQDGWKAFTATLGWLLMVLGAVLPFLLLAVPTLLLALWAVRRTRRPGTRPAAEPPAPAAS